MNWLENGRITFKPKPLPCHHVSWSLLPLFVQGSILYGTQLHISQFYLVCPCWLEQTNMQYFFLSLSHVVFMNLFTDLQRSITKLFPNTRPLTILFASNQGEMLFPINFQLSWNPTVCFFTVSHYRIFYRMVLRGNFYVFIWSFVASINFVWINYTLLRNCNIFQWMISKLLINQIYTDFTLFKSLTAWTCGVGFRCTVFVLMTKFLPRNQSTYYYFYAL